MSMQKEWKEEWLLGRQSLGRQLTVSAMYSRYLKSFLGILRVKWETYQSIV